MGGGGLYLFWNCEKYRAHTFLNIFGQTVGKLYKKYTVY